MVKKTGPFQEASSQELRGIYDFLTVMVRDIGQYQQSNGRSEPSGFKDNIRKLEDLYARFMPEKYRDNVKSLDGGDLRKTHGPWRDGKITHSEISGLGDMRTQIQRELNGRGIAEQVTKIRDGRTKWIQRPDAVPDSAPAAAGAAVPASTPAASSGPELYSAPVYEPVEKKALEPASSVIQEKILPPEDSVSGTPVPPLESPKASARGNPIAAATDTDTAQPQTFAVDGGSPTIMVSGFSAPVAARPPVDYTLPEENAVFSTHVRLMQSFMIQMGHGKHVGEPPSGVMNAGTRMAMESYIAANGLGEGYNDPIMLAVHMHRNLKKGTVIPGVIEGEQLAAPATQTMSPAGEIVDRHGRSPEHCFKQASVQGTTSEPDPNADIRHDLSQAQALRPVVP